VGYDMGLKDIRNNIIMLTDVYNNSHFELKENVDWEVSHIYNRSRGMILYGFNEIVLDILNTKIEVDMVEEAQRYAHEMGLHFPFQMWYDVATKLKGRIPLRVQALPDGTWVPKGTPFAQIENTEDGYGELVTWFEAVFLHSYFASGCATEALKIRQYLEDMGLPLHRVHSFGFRGHHSLEDAYWASTAWNLYLIGTDDYHSKMHTPNAQIKSIPAGAHKVMQQFDNEFEGFKRSIDVASTYESKMVAMVIDTYDPDKVIHEYVQDLLEYAKTKGVHIVFRPDSGDLIGQTKLMWSMYSDYDNWSMIIGEGMSLNKMVEYDVELMLFDYPLDRMAYGIGAGFYKHIDRDYLGHAMKTAFSNGKARMKLTKSNPYKQSIPDMVGLVMEDGLMTVDYTRDGGEDKHNLYQDIWHFDERSTKPKFDKQDWDDIQKIAIKSLNKPLQEGIILSPLVKAKIEEFREKYI